MNSWRGLAFVLIFRVSLLSAADQFPARPTDHAIGNDPTRERVLVLHDSSVQRGLIEKTMTGYVLTKPQGKLVFAFDQVRLMADDLSVAYREQSQACANHAPARIALGRWCLASGLYDEARKEFRRALMLEPNSQVARDLLQKVDKKRLETLDFASVPRVRGGPNGSYSLLGDANDRTKTEPLGGLSRGAAQEFSSRVQPLLVNRCAMAGCHGSGSTQEFQLHRIKVGQRAPRTQVEHNLSAVLDRIDREHPLNSPLLTKLRGEPRANGLRISHGGLTSDQLLTIRRWVASLANNPDEEVPPVIESVETTKPPVESEKPAVEAPGEPEIPEQREPPIETKK